MGTPYKPIHQSVRNFGVEDAPDAILTTKFLENFPGFKVDEFIFPSPEAIQSEDYWDVLAVNLKIFSEKINETLKDNEIQIVIGGDNSVTFSSIHAHLKRVKNIKKIGYIQFDSHGELNRLESSVSKNFHGMYLRTFLSDFDVPEIERINGFKFDPGQLLFIGDLILDDEEQEFFNARKLTNINRAAYLKNPANILNTLAKFISNFEYLIINFDIDIFHRSIAGANGTPADGSWYLDEVMDILNVIKTHPEFTLDLCEVNPKKPGAKQTIKIAQQILLKFLS